ncbi:hypothetical protein BKA69DRAFT_386027 [Paraphysoderma sedebokerense]|nr:hypothetical protein BKA69DRAFT_386027 [Paraphysoderma sedebokerense]
MQRLFLIIGTLCLFCDEFRMKMFGHERFKNVSAMIGCAKCGKPKCDNGKSLKSCSRCLMTMYCSRDCQKNHWREHKKDCKKMASSK